MTASPNAPQPTRATSPRETVATPASPLPRVAVMLAALYALILANGVQLAAGLAEIELSPPADVLPMLGATIALGVAAVPLVRANQRIGYVIGLAFCVLSLIGMGPHKLFVDDAAAIAPLALTGFAFEIVFAREAIRALRGRA
ncbi:MAG: hypothetical protein AAFY28_04775 [Actinomycetota bacterium]